MRPVPERLSSILPKGGVDIAVHRGARRRFRRWPLDAEIELLTPTRGAGLAINASVGGLRVAVDMGVPLDHVCTLRVRTAPDHATVEHARVVWSQARPDGYLLGLEFITAPSAEKH
ncbi:MAG: PilZ domain-containing protein [Deltaproteobacteria bacterium]|nr:PilZ domain-containing protein [Deltaproteobacteria bacterium]NND28953.1 PilZ domain-containing protein [Myxococcales bacterium]MBT8463750.1 PilZ domain-containing protein [Deltaproteobacteria bacterium]MBT8481637.1 PilZ domain-containing protein [Deltaproteobacteria bacterium]NNK09016.1 PilZ domain-containing protein [Myxococcales bacterium]